VEHAVLHLLYSRFWHKVLFDLGYVSTPEPFQKLVNQGLILGEDGEKMSKSRGNVINPDEVIARYGADAFRLYEMFMGPLEQVKPWKTDGLEGTYRFLQRVWRLVVAEDGGLEKNLVETEISSGLDQMLHETIREVTNDLEKLEFNTAIAQLMTFLNELYKLKEIPLSVIETFVLLLAPFAPHIAEELWRKLGNRETLACEPWPSFDEMIAQKSHVEIAVQVNGKIRERIHVASGAGKNELEQAALALEKIRRELGDKKPKKIIVVPGRLVNILI